jgi:hypothetical protein
MKWCWILSKAFSASIELIKCCLPLFLLMCCITFIDLHMLNQPSILRIKHTWWWWIRFAITLLRIFALMLIKEIGL